MFPYLSTGLGPVLGSAVGIDIQINSALGLIEKEDGGSFLMTFNNVDKATWNTDEDIGAEGEWSPGKLEKMWGRVSKTPQQEATISATVDDETVAVDVLVGAPKYDNKEDNVSFQIETRKANSNDEPDSLTGLAGETLTDVRMNIDSPDASKGDILLVADSNVLIALIKKAVKSAGYDVPSSSVLKQYYLPFLPEWPLGGYDNHILAIMHTPDIGQMMEHVRDSQWKGPTLAVTSSPDRGELVRAVRAGACDVVLLPFRADELLAKVERCLD